MFSVTGRISPDWKGFRWIFLGVSRSCFVFPVSQDRVEAQCFDLPLHRKPSSLHSTWNPSSVEWVRSLLRCRSLRWSCYCRGVIRKVKHLIYACHAHGTMCGRLLYSEPKLERSQKSCSNIPASNKFTVRSQTKISSNRVREPIIIHASQCSCSLLIHVRGRTVSIFDFKRSSSVEIISFGPLL